MNRESVVVLLSGGLDSAIAASYLKHSGFTVKAGVFVNRGQSNFNHECVAVQKIAQYLQIPVYQIEFSLPGIGKLLSLEMRKKLGIPARNLILASMALPYAYALDCGMLAFGNIASDTFPDSNGQFRAELSVVASRVLSRQVNVVAPLADWQNWTKGHEIAYANRHGDSALFQLTWSCWLGGKLHCGTCPACLGRKNGFAAANVADPTVYGETEI